MSDVRAVLVVLLVGCGGARPATSKPAVATSCEEVATKVSAALTARLDAEEDDHLRTIVLERCTADHWDEESRHCMATAGPHEDVHACSERLTPEQREALDKEAATVKVKPKTKGIGGGAAPNAAPPPPPSPGKDPCEGGE